MPRLAFLVGALLLGLMIAGDLAAAASPSPAHAAGPGLAAPVPNPTPGGGVPDPGTRPLPTLPTPPPAPEADPTPAPIPPPPTTPPSPDTPPPTPNPTPGPTPPGWSPPDETDTGDPGLFDIPGQIRKAIGDFFAWVAQTGLKPVLDTLGSTVLATPDLTGNPQVRTIWTTSLVVANAVFVLFIIAGGFIVTTRETLQNQYGAKEILPRLAVAGVAANVSLIICGKAIALANALTAGIAGEGVDGPAAAAAISQAATQAATGFSFLQSLLILAMLIMAIVVVTTFILRIAMLVVLIGSAPLALMFHATPQTEGLAYAWWRAIAACFAIQIGQAVVLLATLKVFLTPTGFTVLGIPATGDGLLGILVCLTMLWLLIKIPGWTRQFILGPLAQRHGRGLFGQLLHAYFMVKTLGAAAGLTRARRGPGRAALTRPTRPAGPGPRPSRPPRPPRSPRPTPPPPAPSGPSGPPAPAAFSHAPTVHTPLPQPAGTNGPPVFSNPAPAATPAPSASGSPAPARFSHPPTSSPTRRATARPTAAQFSSHPYASPSRAPRRVSGTGSAVPTFSAAPRPQTAPKRSPAPVTPVFSSAPKPPARSATIPPRRPSTTPRASSTPTARTTPPARPRPAPAARPASSPPVPPVQPVQYTAPGPTPPRPAAPPARPATASDGRRTRSDN